MTNVLIINAHHKYPFAEGRLNRTLVEQANEVITSAGHVTRVVNIDDGFEVEQELSNHQWADTILLQS